MCSNCSRKKCTKNFISYFNAIARQTMYRFLKTYMGKKIFFIIKHKKVTCAKLFSIFDIVSNKILEVKKTLQISVLKTIIKA